MVTAVGRRRLGCLRKKRSIIYPMKEWAAGGSKTAAGITEKINSLDPLLRSYMGPFIFGDSILNFNDTDWPWKKQALFYVRCPWELPPPWTIEDIEADQVNSIFYRRQRW